MSRNENVKVKKKSKWKVVVFLIVVILGCFIVISMFLEEKNKSQKEDSSLDNSTNVVEVATGEVKKTIKVQGHLKPAQEESIITQQNGTIDKLFYALGDRVESGWAVVKVSLNGNQITYEANINGKIEEINYKENQVVTDNSKAIVKIVDDSSYSIKTEVNESDIALIKVDQVATVKLKALPNSLLSGKVHKISSSGSLSDMGKTTFEVEILLESESTEGFKSGMTGEVEINVGQLENVQRLPINTVVLTGNNKGEVRVPDEKGNLSTKEIEVGLIGDAYIEVISGLVLGEKVYTESY